MALTSTNVILVLNALIPIVISSNLITYRLPIPNALKAVLGYPEDNLLDFSEIARKYGYASDEHSVITEDGYILKLYNMWSNRCKELRKPPVLLMHGLLLSSDVWLDAGPNITVAYLLADHCYDVWVGNVRGNYLGRKHVKLDPDRDAQFWDFSYDEMGYFDAPAMIDYILKATGSPKLNYIGYSQGGGMFLIMCSDKPGYCHKVNTFIGLAPVSRLINTRSLVFRGTTQVIEIFSEFLTKIGIQEVAFKGGVLQEALEFICKYRKAAAFCEALIAITDAYDPGSIRERAIRRLFAHFPGGTSRKNAVKFAQAFRTDGFVKFDYGHVENLKIYGNTTPPEIDLTKTKMPVLIIHGLNDHIVDIRDSAWLQERLPNAELQVVDNPLWTHFDIPYSSFVPSLIFPSINKQLLENSDTYS